MRGKVSGGCEWCCRPRGSEGPPEEWRGWRSDQIGGVSSASDGQLVHRGIVHCLFRYKFRVSFDPGDGKVMVAADCIEKAPDPMNARPIAARVDGDVSKESYAILAVGN